MSGWGDQEWGTSLLTGTPWGGGTYPWGPIDFTYLSGSYEPVTERASFAHEITPVASYRGIAASVYHVPALSREASSNPSVTEPGEYRPSYSKVGTP